MWVKGGSLKSLFLRAICELGKKAKSLKHTEAFNTCYC